MAPTRSCTVVCVVPKTQLYIAQSLDGCIADAEGGVDWLDPFHSEHEDYGYSAFFSEVGALAMGANTYRRMLDWQSWPYGDRPAWVFTHERLPVLPDADVRFTDEDPEVAIGELKAAAGDRNVWLVGGGDLLAQFIDGRLLDEMLLFIVPVMLGRGTRLFRDSRPADAMLTATTAYDSGLVELRYRFPRR